MPNATNSNRKYDRACGTCWVLGLALPVPELLEPLTTCGEAPHSTDEKTEVETG